ncbi:MAG TPA: hypothetical protein VFL57_01020, partial [Bryobacteraceae bacterium]|nr:hypothetical protein [Bryobacteraceae bacterium]
GLTSAIACALFSHAWAILLFVPFGAGEIARAYRRRRADWTLWCCLAVAATSMAGVLPLLRLARSVTFGAALFQPSWRYVPNTYEMLLAPALWPMLGGMVLAAFWLARQAHMRPVAVENGLAEHEYIAAIGFLAIPAVAVMVAGVMHTAFMNRYGVLGVMGIALTGTSLAHRLTNGDRRFGLRLACWMMLAMAGQFGYWLYELMASDPPPAEQSGLIHAAKLPPIHEVSPELPFVSSSALQFLELDLYSPDSLKSRMFYLMDPEAAMRITQSNVYEAALPNVVRLFPVKAKLARYQEFTKQHPKFLVYGPYFHSLDWLMQKLIEDRAHLRLIGVYRGAYGDNLLLEVTVR